MQKFQILTIGGAIVKKTRWGGGVKNINQAVIDFYFVTST